MTNNTIINEEPIEAGEENKAADQLDEYEESAQYLQILFTQFRTYGYELAKRKKKAPIRVLESFIFGGLHDMELCGKEEKELLDLCKQAMYHKNKLVEYMLKRKQEKENESKKV